MKLLIENGADLNVANKLNNTALTLAISEGIIQENIKQSQKIVSKILNHFA